MSTYFPYSAKAPDDFKTLLNTADDNYVSATNVLSYTPSALGIFVAVFSAIELSLNNVFTSTSSSTGVLVSTNVLNALSGITGALIVGLKAIYTSKQTDALNTINTNVPLGIKLGYFDPQFTGLPPLPSNVHTLFHTAPTDEKTSLVAGKKTEPTEEQQKHAANAVMYGYLTARRK
jgi:hypothetical protein